MRHKNIFLLTVVLATIIVTVSSCGRDKRDPGRIYMPDMAISRAYKTYIKMDTTAFTTDRQDAQNRIFFNRLPVKGTVKRGELFAFTVPNDSNGLVNLSAQVKNPLGPLTKADSLEAARLFNINCAVCHGAKGENNGPVAAKIGGVKSIIAGSPGYSDGRLFYVMTYGQNNMGSYASQLDRKQRWMIVHYIRSLEPKKEAAVTTTVAKADSATVKKG